MTAQIYILTSTIPLTGTTNYFPVQIVLSNSFDGVIAHDTQDATVSGSGTLQRRQLLFSRRQGFHPNPAIDKHRDFGNRSRRNA